MIQSLHRTFAAPVGVLACSLSYENFLCTN